MANIKTKFTEKDKKQFGHSGEIQVNDIGELLELAGFEDITLLEDVIRSPEIGGNLEWSIETIGGDFLSCNYEPISFDLFMKGDFEYEDRDGNDLSGDINFKTKVLSENISLKMHLGNDENEDGQIEFDGGFAELYVDAGEIYMDIIISNL